MINIKQSQTIKDVFTVEFQFHADERGRFHEMFRKKWFPQRTWNIIQMNRSDSQAGVLRGLHYHHHQVDYWYVIQGSMRAGLADIRPESATYLAQQVIDINEDNRIGLFIPIGVAHGFFALTEVSLMYVVDNYYDGTDEHGVAWNDPQLNVNWGIENPIISKRDMGNPFLKDIPPENLGAVK